MTYPSEETAQKLAFFVEREGGVRAACRALGLPESMSATISRILRGEPVSLARENEIREILGLPPLHVEMRPAPVCPVCGVVHAIGDCKGKLRQGGQIIIRAKPQKRNRPTGDYRPRIPRKYKEHFQKLIREELKRLEAMEHE